MSDLPVFVLSDGSVNSYGFRLDMDKIDTERFRSNPVMLYNHYELIGKWTDIELKDGILKAKPQFLEGEGEELAAKIRRRVEKGFLKGASLGIRILSTGRRSGEPPVVTAEVMEASIVDIPSNKNALALYDEAGNRLEGEAFELALQRIGKPISKPNSQNMELTFSKDTLQRLGLQPGADMQAVERAIELLAAERDQLLKQLEEIKQRQIDELLQAAIEDGRIDASTKEDFQRLGQTDFELFKKTLSGLPKAQKLPGAHPVPPVKHPLMAGREDWTFADWRKKDTPGLLRIKREAPDVYQEIINKK